MTAAPLPKYPYMPLPVGDVFRYLILQPGAVDHPLDVSLHTAAITDVEYNAVSYVWGASTKDQTVVCDGHTMLITPNLARVLRCVRSPKEPLVLWADSICINQEDKIEKGHQVVLMGKIYRCAKRVLIYLGPDEDNDGPAVASLLDEVDQMIQETCQSIDMSWDSFPYLEDDDDLLSDARWDSFRVLLSQSWFDRGWVVQEAASAPYGEVIWGNSRIDWQKLMRTYVWLSTRGTSIYHEKSFSDVQINAHTDVYLEIHAQFSRIFYSQLSWGTNSLLRTLNCAKELDLSNPRDRIYAFMDLPQNATQRILIVPDYLSSHLDTYYRFAVEYIGRTKDTELLDYVCHDEESLSGARSWVPRWDINTWSLSQSCSSSSVLGSRKDALAEPLVTDNGSLRVRGVLIDTIHYASKVLDWETTTPETIHDIWKEVDTADTINPYTSQDHPRAYKVDAFFGSLAAGLYDGEYSQWRQARALFAHEIRIDYKHIDDDQHSESAVAGAEDGENIFFDTIRSRTHNRRFILTARGYMGLAPAVACKGDSCGIIFGCKTPCILRKAGSAAQEYAFLGSTALMGKEHMNAEDDDVLFCTVLGEEDSKDWVEWDVEEQDVYLR